MAKGFLIVNVYTDNLALPLRNVNVKVSGENYENSYITDENGSSQKIELDTVSKELTNEYKEEGNIPFKLYDIEIEVFGLVKTIIRNIEIYEGITSNQNVFLTAKEEGKQIKEINLTVTEIWKSNTPKILEPFVADISKEKILKQVVIPEYIVVHNGIPTDSNAPNYNIRFVDYIKNVACSEIYSTWPKETIKANVYCIISFALNRIYTEWYKVKGYNFNITGSSAYDQKYTHNRPIFDSISNIVDEIFTEYISKKDVNGPLLALYCDGKVSNYDRWFKQWGSKELGDRGLTAIEILKTYYGNNISLQTAVKVEGVPISYPGYILEVGECCIEVQQVQNLLNYITGSYPGIPKSNTDGNYTSQTKKTVEVFQKVFKLPVTGKINYVTWYKISYIYVAVNRMLDGIYK